MPRFGNWLSNGQITGSEGLSTTESGSYFLNGAMTAAAISLVHRSATATAVIPTLDEWYKAAYYDPATNSYFRFPTSSNTIPSNSYADTGNNANFYVNLVGYTVGPPLYFTDVGHFAASASPNGTFDQGGNVWEWNETLINLKADKQLVFADGLDSAWHLRHVMDRSLFQGGLSWRTHVCRKSFTKLRCRFCHRNRSLGRRVGGERLGITLC